MLIRVLKGGHDMKNMTILLAVLAMTACGSETEERKPEQWEGSYRLAELNITNIDTEDYEQYFANGGCGLEVAEESIAISGKCMVITEKKKWQYVNIQASFDYLVFAGGKVEHGIGFQSPWEFYSMDYLPETGEYMISNIYDDRLMYIYFYQKD